MEPDINSKRKGTKHLFANPVLEYLSRTHIAVPISIFIFYSAGLLAWSIIHTLLNVWATTALFIAGVLSFTWLEYIVHRYVFHMKTHTPFRKRLQYVLHGVHHEYPKDKERIAMPPLMSIAIATLLLFFFRIILGDWAFAFMPGFLCGYAGYLFVHYLVHIYPPPHNIFKTIWINHSIHHYKNGDSTFGVSSPLWDYIYGTLRVQKTKDDNYLFKR